MKNVLVLCFKKEFDLAVKIKLAQLRLNVLSFSENLEKGGIVYSIDKFRNACGIVVVYGHKKSDYCEEVEEMKKVYEKNDVKFVKI